MVFIVRSRKFSIIRNSIGPNLVKVWAFSAFFHLYAQNIPSTAIDIGARGSETLTWVLLDRKIQSLAIEYDRFDITAKAIKRRQTRGIASARERKYIDQAVSLDFINRIKGTGAKIKRVSRWINAVSVSATPKQLDLIESLPFVESVQPVKRSRRRKMRPIIDTTITNSTLYRADGENGGLSDDQLTMLNVPAMHELGYTGKNVTVLVLDTGFMTNHSAIDQRRIVNQYDFINDDNQTQNENDYENTINQHDHGTSVYSIIGGYVPGSLIGPAFECDFLLAKTEMAAEEDIIEEHHFVAGLEWGELLGADIASSSIGWNEWYEYEQMDGQTAIATRAVQQAVRLGMVVVAGAGNERASNGKPGWGGYILAPADADSIITVGAVNTSGYVASFSSIGPTADGRIKPEVAALGVGVYAASSHGPDTYTSRDGTSFAAPLITGCAALLLEAHPAWRPIDVRSALINTASQHDQPDYYMGYGIVDVLAAYNYNPADTALPGENMDVETIIAYPNPFNINEYGEATIAWNLVARTAVEVDVYNILGEHVINLYDHSLQEPDSASVPWKGVDYRGRKVASGVYLIRLRTDQKTNVTRLTVQR